MIPLATSIPTTSVTIGSEVMAENKLTIFFNKDNLVESWIIEKSSEE